MAKTKTKARGKKKAEPAPEQGSNGGGRPSLLELDPTIVEKICARLSKGEPMARICQDNGMPCERTVRNWIEDNEDVSAAIARAREAGFDAIALECLEIADDSRNDYIERLADNGDAKADEARLNGEHIQRARLRVETRLKLLAKWDPKRYGEKSTVDANHTGQVAITVVTGVPR